MKTKQARGSPQLDPKAYVHRMHTREQWLAYAETMSTHDIEATSLQAYRGFCKLFRLIQRETDYILVRVYTDLYDRLLGLDYSRYRQGDQSNSISQIIMEINDMRRIKYRHSPTTTSATWLWGLLKWRKGGTMASTPTLQNACLQTTPVHWTPQMAANVKQAFQDRIPHSPIKTLLAYKIETGIDAQDTHRDLAEIRKAQRASFIVHAAVTYLSEEDVHRLPVALTAKTSQEALQDTYIPLFIPIPPATLYREGSSLIPSILKLAVYPATQGRPNARDTLFVGTKQDTNLLRRFVGSEHRKSIGNGETNRHVSSTWMQPYNIEEWS